MWIDDTDEVWVDAEDLEIGDLVLALDGDYGVVEATLTEARTQTMYDLDVAIVDTFAVGDGAWVVHNSNAHEVCLLGFRGAGRNPIAQGEHPLIQVGHVGVSIDGGSTIYGFWPHGDASRQVTGEGISTLDFLKFGGRRADTRDLGNVPSSGGAIQGYLQNDTAVFVRAYELSQQGAPTNVHNWVQHIDDINLSRLQAEITRYQTGNPITSWYNFPPRNSNVAMPINCNNCATYPRRFGLQLPESSGNLKVYIPALEAVGVPWKPR